MTKEEEMEKRRLEEYDRWYREDEIGGRRLESFFELLYIGVPLFLVVWFYLNTNKQNQSNDGFKKEYLSQSSSVQKKITLLGTRPSGFKRFQK
ncbi:MAG: hypothetical protein WCO58_00615 [bacterium]